MTPSTALLRHRIRQALQEYLVTIVFYVGLLVIWEVAVSHTDLVPRFLVPAPSGVIRSFFDGFFELLIHARRTVWEILIGFGLAIALAFLAALGVSYSSFLRRVFYPLALFFQTTPKEAFAPVLVVWLGFRIAPKVVITALVCFFPIFVNAVLGLASTDPRLLELFHTLNASRAQTFFKARLPSAVPHIFAGLKIGITLAVIGAVIAEWVGSDAGLGYLVLTAMGRLDLDFLFATLMMIGLVGFLLYAAIAFLGHRLAPHHPSVGTEQRML